MVSVSSIWAILLRHARLFKRAPNLILYTFYWPLLDIVTWGFLGAWIAQSGMTEFKNYEAVALLGVLLWQVVGRGCNALFIGITEELWSNNIVNLFSLPLRISEWIIGIILLTGIMILLTTVVCMFIIFALYDVVMWDLVSTFCIFFPPLFIACLWVGFTGLQIMILLGNRGIQLANVFTWFLLPFSGANYPIEVLPIWAQKVSSVLPMSYLFQGLRGYLMHQQDPTPYLVRGYVLSIVYAIFAILMFVYCFNRSKQRGLARLMD